MSSPNLQCDGSIVQKFLSRQLSADEETAMESHLDHCTTCRGLLDGATAKDEGWSDACRYLPVDQLDGEPSLAHVGSLSNFPDNDKAGVTAALVRRLSAWLDATDDPRMLGRFGGYEIAGIIGQGGMGVVLKGHEAALNRYVAIKVLAPHLASNGTARQRFSREAQAAAAVLHENVIAIHRVDESQGLPYLVMPYIAGVSLQKRIDQNGALPLLAVLRISRQIAAGLAAAHAQGIVHRDVKPANILLERGVDRVTLTDFGLARAIDDATLTCSGVIAGTPQYMSPEQARGDAVDIRSDLFSLGSVIYAMCTGQPPFRAETSYGILRRITDNVPRPIREINPEVPEWLATIVERLHAKSCGDRFQTPSEIGTLLEHCLAHVQQPTVVPFPSHLMPPGVQAATDKSHRAKRKQRLWAAGIVVGVSAIVVVLTIGFWPEMPQQSDVVSQPRIGASTSNSDPATNWNDRVAKETEFVGDALERLGEDLKLEMILETQ